MRINAMAKVQKDKQRNSKSKVEAVRNGVGKFFFANGDSYEGEYLALSDTEIYRHGYGVYKTSDQDEYRALWDKDSISSDLHIMYSNKAQYIGQINEEGAMEGNGTYIFPDGTTITAVWKDNEPIASFSYLDPLRHEWEGELSMTGQEVHFTPVNRMWDNFDPLQYFNQSKTKEKLIDPCRR